MKKFALALALGIASSGYGSIIGDWYSDCFVHKTPQGDVSIRAYASFDGLNRVAHGEPSWNNSTCSGAPDFLEEARGEYSVGHVLASGATELDLINIRTRYIYVEKAYGVFKVAGDELYLSDFTGDVGKRPTDTDPRMQMHRR